MALKDTLIKVRSTLYGIDPFFLRLYLKLFFTPKKGTTQETLASRTKGISPFYFLQIGGNDGFVNDPIFKLIKRDGWKGIIAEPQKKVFNDKLKRTYRLDKNVILENVAISDKTETRKLYKLTMSEARWATGIATFDRETLEKQIDSGHVERKAKKEGVSLPAKREDYITYEEVECLTIIDLLDKHKQKHLNLLQIDTEGYDYEIIKTIDFSKMKPDIISFEHEHLSKNDREICVHLLTSHGYKIELNPNDVIAYLDK